MSTRRRANLTNKLKIKQFEFKEELTYRNTAVLNYTIRFPEFQSGVAKFQKAVLTMNRFYRQEALHMVKHSRKNLYCDAVAQYHDSVEHGYPVMTYEVYVDNTVTYNENCAVSLYTDQYIFTGGCARKHNPGFKHLGFIKRKEDASQPVYCFAALSQRICCQAGDQTNSGANSKRRQLLL